MPFYQRLGSVPNKRHIAHRRKSGELYYEQLVGTQGFQGPSALLYHLRLPTQVRHIELFSDLAPQADPDARLRLRHFRTSQLACAASPTVDRTPVLFNDDCTLGVVRASEDDEHFYRNADGDEYIYVHQGQGTLQTQFGNLTFSPGEQLIIPRGVLYRFKKQSSHLGLLVVESRGHWTWPRRYHNEMGQLLEGAPYSERDIQVPQDLQTIDKNGDFPILIKKRDQLHQVVLDHHPLDVVGWDGTYYPWSFSIHNFEPLVGTIHQPPPIHQILQAQNLVVCNFVPRRYDFHPEAIPAPYNHSNVMSDEVLYYASDRFMSRKGIETGSITLHPDGLPHGPHPQRIEDSIGQEHTDELAIMLDTFRPLQVAIPALATEDQDYLTSWLD